jgi:hypothetical protein
VKFKNRSFIVRLTVVVGRHDVVIGRIVVVVVVVVGRHVLTGLTVVGLDVVAGAFVVVEVVSEISALAK